MTTRRPRLVLIAAIVLLGAVLAVFALLILQANGNERDAAQKRFRDQAVVTAALTESVFASTSGSAAEQNAQRFGDARVNQAKLEKLKKQNRQAYAVVLDDRSVPLAFTAGTDPAVLERLSEKPADVERVLGSAPFRLSNVLDGGKAMEYYSPFEGADGKRVLVSGFRPLLISTFLAGYLGQLPDADNERAFIIDSADRVVATTAAGVPAGSMAKVERKGSENAAAPVGGSEWRVILSQKTSVLYAGIGSTVQWLIFAALALAGIVVLFLLARAARTAADLASAYEHLGTANADLERTNVELIRSNSELEQFASVASHDLQEPLRKVQTFGDQLERRFGEELPDEAVDFLRRMRNAAGRMSVLIEDLLRFSRVTTHAKQPERVDLEQVAEDVTRDLYALVSETHGRVDVEALPAVLADPFQMRQLLQNLIANALKFHRPGIAPVVTLEAAETREPGMVAFTVSDKGIGFEQQYDERIFRVFERLHPRDVFAGTGIGLALCRKIAERHGGTIIARGTPDEGAVFTVTLPAAGRTPAAKAPVREPASV